VTGLTNKLTHGRGSTVFSDYIIELKIGAGIAQWYSARLRAGNFSLHHRVQTGSGAHPASYRMSIRSSFTGGEKRPGREADHSHPTNAEVKECLELYLHFQIRLHGVVSS